MKHYTLNTNINYSLVYDLRYKLEYQLRKHVKVEEVVSSISTQRAINANLSLWGNLSNNAFTLLRRKTK